MEISSTTKNLLAGLGVGISKDNIFLEKQNDSPVIEKTINYPSIKPAKTKCYACEEQNTFWCFNCNTPHCDKHGKVLVFGGIIKTLCLDCASKL